MQRRSRKGLVVLVAILLLIGILGFRFLVAPKSNPALSVTYTGAVDGKGHWKLRFAITNVGNCTVFPSASGQIEVFNHTNPLSIGVTAPSSELAPGQGHLVEAVLSDDKMQAIDGKWRYTCFYASDELRSRIYHWQWARKGPGASANSFIPQKLKGMPLTVIGTGDWIEPVK
jgi:hypothetical protein